MTTLQKLKEAESARAPYLTSDIFIRSVVIQMSELDVNELYKDGRFDREKTVGQIRSMCYFKKEDTDTLGKMIDQLIRFKAFIDDIDDDIAMQAIEEGKFEYDFDAGEEYYIAPPGEEYRSECLWSYYEAMHLLSYIHMGFCINTMKL